MKKFNKINCNEFNFFDASVIYKSIYNPEKTICIYLNDYSDKEYFLLALDEELLQDGENLYTFDCYQDVPECFIENEAEISEKFWEFLQALVNATKEEGFIAFLNGYYEFEYVDNIDFEFAVNDFNDRYYGHWRSKIEFAEHVLEDCYGLNDSLGSVSRYFDFESFANDLFNDEYDFVDGHVFMNA